MNLEKFISENLLNKNGKLEGQRLKEKWFKRNHFTKEWEFFKDKCDSKTLYMYVNNSSDKCECGNIKRYIGFKEGFKEYCEKCGRIKNNVMKKQGIKDLELGEIIYYVKDKNNKYSSTKIKKLSQKTINEIIDRTNYLNINSKLSERLYHIEYNMIELPNCKLCGRKHNNFKFSEVGYSDYCKGKCSRTYNKDDRTNSLKQYYYNKYAENFKTNDEYEIEMFSLENYLKNKNCKIKFKHIKCEHEYILDKTYQGHSKCPKCYPIRSKQQYEIYDWLKTYTNCTFNDRKFIAPKELDILADNFAIEYDGITFHSYGKSEFTPLNNTFENKYCHLDKTELVEEKDYQLFRIFSNEWYNQKDIWQSILNSKIGNTKRIYARKCIIKEVSSLEAREFCINNHLQGYINSSVRIGLYYNNELISLMTFGKTRRSKWKGLNNYELYRFCSKLNTTTVGGASKLITFFEKTYKPNLIVSYANRRWSTGNLYEKLNFNFVNNTEPNYFYFKKETDVKLLSREQFQKHKLKDKLDIFDSNLTETENMFNNNYRKIYDCGNKVYIKQF